MQCALFGGNHINIVNIGISFVTFMLCGHFDSEQTSKSRQPFNEVLSIFFQSVPKDNSNLQMSNVEIQKTRSGYNIN